MANRQEPTGLPLDTLQRVGQALSQPPPNFQLHPDMAKLVAARKAMVQVRGWWWLRGQAVCAREDRKTYCVRLWLMDCCGGPHRAASQPAARPPAFHNASTAPCP